MRQAGKRVHRYVTRTTDYRKSYADESTNYHVRLNSDRERTTTHAEKPNINIQIRIKRGIMKSIVRRLNPRVELHEAGVLNENQLCYQSKKINRYIVEI